MDPTYNESEQIQSSQPPIPSQPPAKAKVFFLGLGATLLLVAFLLGGYFVFTSKNHSSNVKTQQSKPTISQTSVMPQTTSDIVYVEYHAGSVSGFDQSRNPEALKNDFSDIYSLNPDTHTSSLLFSDKNEQFHLPIPDASTWMVTKVDTNTLVYNAENRKFIPFGDNEGVMKVNIQTKKATRDASLQNISYLSSSRNGTLLTYSTGRDRTKIDGPLEDIRLMNTQTHVVKQLVDIAKLEKESGPQISALAFSPNGKSIATVTLNGGPGDSWGELLIVDTETGEVHSLIQKKDHVMIGNNPFWASDTELTFFASDTSPNAEWNYSLYSIQQDGSNLKKIYSFALDKKDDRAYDYMLDKTGENVFYIGSYVINKNDEYSKQITQLEIRKVHLQTHSDDMLKTIQSIPGSFVSLRLVN
jgi:hypothetical protein